MLDWYEERERLPEAYGAAAKSGESLYATPRPNEFTDSTVLEKLTDQKSIADDWYGKKNVLYNGNAEVKLLSAKAASSLPPGRIITADETVGEKTVSYIEEGEFDDPRIKEFAYHSSLYSFDTAVEIMKFSDHAFKMGDEYAEKKGYYDEEGNLVSWENEADALRHFVWNAMVARNYGQEVAKAAGDAHEIQNVKTAKLSEKGTKLGDEIIYTQFNQSTLMDLFNNAAGRHFAVSEALKDYSYEELFQDAKSKDRVITDAATVYDRLGISKDYLIDTYYNLIYAEWDVLNGTITVKKKGLPDKKILLGRW